MVPQYLEQSHALFMYVKNLRKNDPKNPTLNEINRKIREFLTEIYDNPYESFNDTIKLTNTPIENLINIDENYQINENYNWEESYNKIMRDIDLLQNSKLKSSIGKIYKIITMMFLIEKKSDINDECGECDDSKYNKYFEKNSWKQLKKDIKSDLKLMGEGCIGIGIGLLGGYVATAITGMGLMVCVGASPWLLPVGVLSLIGGLCCGYEISKLGRKLNYCGDLSYLIYIMTSIVGLKYLLFRTTGLVTFHMIYNIISNITSIVGIVWGGVAVVFTGGLILGRLAMFGYNNYFCK